MNGLETSTAGLRTALPNLQPACWFVPVGLSVESFRQFDIDGIQIYAARLKMSRTEVNIFIGRGGAGDENEFK